MLFQTYGEKLLLIKVVLVVILVILIYAHGLYYGKKIVKLAREKDLEGLKNVRRRSRIISFSNLALMIVILVLAVMLQT